MVLCSGAEGGCVVAAAAGGVGVGRCVHVAVAIAVGVLPLTGGSFGFLFCCGFLVEASLPVEEGGEGPAAVLCNRK